MVYYIYRSRFDSGLMCCESAFKLTFDMVVFWCFTKITRRWSTIHLYYARVIVMLARMSILIHGLRMLNTDHVKGSCK